MEINKKIFFVSAIITLLLFISIFSFNLFLNQKRELVVFQKIDNFVEGYEDMRAISLLSDVLGNETTCLSLESSLLYMNKEIWEVGKKIDSYRTVTRQFLNDPFYIKMKKRFNREEITYFSILKKMKEKCNVNKTIILYFYKNSEECPWCDAQSFVLTDLNKNIHDETAVFSFDTDMPIPAITILTNFYNVSSYPCMVIEDYPYCGKLYNKDELKNLLCQINKNISVC